MTLHGLGNEASSAHPSVKYRQSGPPSPILENELTRSPLAHTGDPYTPILRQRDRDGDKGGTSVHGV